MFDSYFFVWVLWWKRTVILWNDIKLSQQSGCRNLKTFINRKIFAFGRRSRRFRRQVERPSIAPPRWSHRVPLLCASSLGCLCGDGHASSSAGLNILFTSTLLETRAHIRQRKRRRVFGLHLRPSRPCPPPHRVRCRLHALHLCAPDGNDTHPSRSISSVLKVNTWEGGNI